VSAERLRRVWHFAGRMRRHYASSAIQRELIALSKVLYKNAYTTNR